MDFRNGMLGRDRLRRLHVARCDGDRVEARIAIRQKMAVAHDEAGADATDAKVLAAVEARAVIQGEGWCEHGSIVRRRRLVCNDFPSSSSSSSLSSSAFCLLLILVLILVIISYLIMRSEFRTAGPRNAIKIKTTTKITKTKRMKTKMKMRMRRGRAPGIGKLP